MNVQCLNRDKTTQWNIRPEQKLQPLDWQLYEMDADNDITYLRAYFQDLIRENVWAITNRILTTVGILMDIIKCAEQDIYHIILSSDDCE